MKSKNVEIMIFLIMISYISPIIIIPFQTYNPLLAKNVTLLGLISNSSNEEIINAIFYNLIYTNINIGANNYQSIQTFIEMPTKESVMRDKNNNDYSQNQRKKSTDFYFSENILLKDLIRNEYYNSSNSISYKFIKRCYEATFYYIISADLCGNETISLTKKDYKTDKEIIIQSDLNIKFKPLDIYDQRPGVIGLNHNNTFISELKDKGKINNYAFTFKYFNSTEDKGEIIIGDLPHIYDRGNYVEKNLRNAKIYKDKISVGWSLTFDVLIKLKNANKSDFILDLSNIFTFNIEQFFITASNKYLIFIEEKFFTKYIDEKICEKYIYRHHDNIQNFFYFICNIDNENKKEELFNEFPELIFYQKEMDYNFILNAKDLFTILPDGKRILFNINFLYNSNEWILGKPFFKKYQMIFNHDSNLISYYIKQSNINVNIKGNNIIKWNGLKIILIIFLIIFLVAFGIMFDRFLCIKYNRKLRANELEDNFSYAAKDSKNINQENDLMYFNFKNDNNNI